MIECSLQSSMSCHDLGLHEGLRLSCDNNSLVLISSFTHCLGKPKPHTQHTFTNFRWPSLLHLLITLCLNLNIPTTSSLSSSLAIKIIILPLKYPVLGCNKRRDFFFGSLRVQTPVYGTTCHVKPMVTCQCYEYDDSRSPSRIQSPRLEYPALGICSWIHTTHCMSHSLETA